MRVETIGNATLYMADCREVLPTLPKVDAVLTDPPYGIGVGKMSMGSGRKTSSFESFDWDESAPDVAWLAGWPAIVWGGNYFGLPASGKWLCWDKIQEFSGADFELAWTNLGGPSKAFRMCRAQAYGAIDKQHPTQKPVALMEWCLAFLPEAESILDPFMGSGTTGAACMNLGRSFIGIEREPKYFEIACRRIDDAQRQARLIP